ncbi:MAG: ABC transporter permease [Candidatus Melainabacteria bacterium]|nr:ABC transporter permease [Candidatus Melainabacteria bacterium]
MKIEGKVIGSAILLSVLLFSLSGLFAPDSLCQLDKADIAPFQNWQYPLGTDGLGRDLLLSAMKGGVGTLSVGLASAMLASLAGFIWGSAGALSGGTIDNISTAIVDGLLSIPTIVLLLTISSLISAPELTHAMPQTVQTLLKVSEHSLGYLPIISVVFAIASTSWLEAARVARGMTLKLKGEDYVLSARAMGASNLEILVRHLLPALAGLAALEATLLTADAIILESGLSYLGLGLGSGTPSWGSMLREGQIGLFCGNAHAAIIPGLLIAFTVLSINLISDSIAVSKNSGC